MFRLLPLRSVSQLPSLTPIFSFPASSYSSLFPTSSKNYTFTPKHKFLLKFGIDRNRKKHFLQRVSRRSIPKLNARNVVAFRDVVVADKLHLLVSEFQSLSEPIDRVKKLLHYAALLPLLEESNRVPKNRVRGCATQVWVVAEMDEYGRMKFKADSDSEISKGFCGCLIWVLDGAEPEKVLMMETEDLADINVGNLKAQSRVNTWQNVLFSMQKATKTLVVEMDGKPPLRAFSFFDGHG